LEIDESSEAEVNNKSNDVGSKSGNKNVLGDKTNEIGSDGDSMMTGNYTMLVNSREIRYKISESDWILVKNKSRKSKPN
jgi:hypothetical protein